MERHHPSWRKTDLRVLRGDRSEGHRHHPQGVRRRVRRHGVKTPRWRHLAGLANCPNCRDGCAGCGQHPLTAKELKAADDPEVERARLLVEYDDELANPYLAAERGYVDRVIEPHETRKQVVLALRALRNKRETLPPKKHGNIPL